MSQGIETAAGRLFAGPGEMRDRCRGLDWATTPLGAVDGWSPELQTVVRLVLDAPGAMCLYIGTAFITLYSDAYRSVLGAKHPAALGQPAAKVWSEIWSTIGPQYEQVRAGGPGLDLHDVPFRLGRLDGGAAEEGWFHYALSAVRDEHPVADLHGATAPAAAILAVVTETTARVRAERALEVERARLAEVFRAAPAFLAVLRGPGHVFSLVNDAYYQLVGHRELLGKPLFDALPDIRDQGFEGLLDGVLATGEPFVGRELPVLVVRTPDAQPEERFVDLVYLPLVEADGSRAGIIAHGTDVTDHVGARRDVERLLAERERLLAAERAARADAEEANRAKSQFLAVMSHELRTPLNAIGGYAQLVELGVHGPVTDAQLTALARIQSSQRHLLGLIAGVLDYSRVESGTMTYRLTDVAVGEAVAEAEALVAPQIRAKGLDFRWSGCPSGLAARADREKLQQILVNLLGNALKFTHARGSVRGCIEVHCARSSTSGADAVGEWVSLSVCDTGEGIPPDQLAQVFEPFVQVDQRFTRPHEGVGLGLAISRDLARGMGGDITVVSMLGVGSTFTLTLPSA